jgi:hypothetical protein
MSFAIAIATYVLKEKNTMKIGMLWFDNSQASLDDKIRKAVTYYDEKYHKHANACVINPNEVPYRIEDGTIIAGVAVRESRAILKGYFWIGVSEG